MYPQFIDDYVTLVLTEYHFLSCFISPGDNTKMRQIFFWILIFNVPAFGNGIPAFTLIDPSYKYVTQGNCGSDNGKCEIAPTKMPRIASQDGLGICYACAAATLMQAENCRLTPSVDCSNLPKEELFSILDLTRITPPEQGKEAFLARSAYPGLKLNPDTGDGGDPHATAIIAAIYTKRTANEACVSLDTILSKMNSKGETAEAQRAMWTRLKRHYQKIQESTGCKDCLSKLHATALDDINQNLDIKLSNEEILKTFGEKSYDKFLDKLTGADKCVKTNQSAFFENTEGKDYEQFPPAESPSSEKLKNPEDRKNMIGKIKEVLKSGRPIAMSGICIGAEDPGNCRDHNKHASVIAGYREICDQPRTTSNKPKCRQSLKIINCWGKSWQEQNDDGWIDAESLFKHTMNKPNILGWFKDKK